MAVLSINCWSYLYLYSGIYTKDRHPVTLERLDDE